ncbi:putative short transient receptor potential channel 2-like protein isoform X2 [Falco naumanni]|uniref:putative short transient receptor potential channel 2-like protein isoform X2 n=1 Tax=Falco naumanni TaxID=148594 RepID=UPI001ADE8427|nr:putative short transient receptor potential channel 2-like protein isoform X2 [Falco naumanni]
MTPADSKLDQNRCRVRMFKEADFLVLAVGQKWDRLRLTCSQPFSKHSHFGLSFIHVRTLLDPEDIQPPPPSQQSLEDPEPADSPWRSSPAFCWTFFPNPCSSSREEEQLKSRLQQLEPAACSPACLSRPAQMVLSAVWSQALRHRASTGAQGGDPELPAEDPGLCQLPQGSPQQKEEPEPTADVRDRPRGVTAVMTRAFAPYAQVTSAWISLHTPPAVERKILIQPGLHPCGQRHPATPGCAAPSVSCPLMWWRWNDMPALVKSRQGHQAPWPHPTPWGRAVSTVGTSPMSWHSGTEAVLLQWLETLTRTLPAPSGQAAACTGRATALDQVTPWQGTGFGEGTSLPCWQRGSSPCEFVARLLAPQPDMEEVWGLHGCQNTVMTGAGARA